MSIPQWDTEFEPTGPFKDKFKHCIRRQKEFCTTFIIALYASYGDFPLLMDERHYQESIKAGKILNLHEYDLILRNELLPLTPMQVVLDPVRSKEPKPKGHEVRMDAIKYTTVGLLEDFLYKVEEVRVIFRADKNQDVIEWPYKRSIGDAASIEILRERLNKTYPDLKYEIVDGRGMMQHLRNVCMGKIRESYVANIT